MHLRHSQKLTLCATLLLAGCAGAADSSPTTSSEAAATDLRLIALLPMQAGFGPAEHDAYEARIAPIMKDHGMVHDSVHTVTSFVGGAGPREASSIGIWSLAAPDSMQGVMGDARYQEQIPYRNEIHDMPNTAMYMAREVFSADPPAPGHALLVGLLAMNPDCDFEDHLEYEKAIESVTARHGMRLVRSFEVMQPMGGAGPQNVVAVSLWELPTPEALGAIMSDPEYMENTDYRDKIHDMAATTMYFVTERSGS